MHQSKISQNYPKLVDFVAVGSRLRPEDSFQNQQMKNSPNVAISAVDGVCSPF